MPPMLGSGIAMGPFPEVDALANTDAAGALAGDELRQIGWQGEADPHTLQTLDGSFDLHIEQGPILENEGVHVGIVIHAAAQAWFR